MVDANPDNLYITRHQNFDVDILVYNVPGRKGYAPIGVNDMAEAARIAQSAWNLGL